MGIMIKTEFKVGLFLVVSILLILSALGYMAYRKGLFQAEKTINLSSQTGDGLTVGMPLIFSGFKIGRVADLELDERGLVLVRIKVPDQHAKWLRNNSRFILERPLIGSTKLLVETTDMSSTPLTATSTPMITEINDINETIKKFEPVLEKLALTMDHMEKVTGTLAGKGSLVEMAVGDKKSIEALYGALKDARAITQRAGRFLQRTEEELYGADGVTPAIQTVLTEVVVNLKKLGLSLDNVTSISADAADSTKNLKVLRRDLDVTIHSVNRLIEQIDQRLPFKSEKEIRLP